MSTQLQKIAAKAQQDPKACFTSLAQVLTPVFFQETWRQLNHQGTRGIDGETIEEFELHREERIQALVQRLKAEQYDAPPVRRVEIPKGNGTPRPLGILTVEDRLLQRAVARILSAIYEEDFLTCSFGYRTGRNPHMALKALRDHVVTGKVRYICETDIQGYFTNINREWLRKMIALRIADPVITGLIGKWLKAGVMEHGVVARPAAGTPQGGPITPPTKLQTFFFGIRIARVRINPKDDIDLVPGHVYSLHEGSNQLALARPIGHLSTVVDFACTVFQTAHTQGQFRVHGRLIRQLLALFFQADDALTHAEEPGCTLGLVAEPVCITVDASCDPLPQRGHLLFDGRQRRTFAPRLRLEAAAICLGEPLGMGQQRPDFPPYRAVQQIRPSLGLVPEALTAKAIRVRPQTPGVRVRTRFTLAGTGTQALAVLGLPTLRALDHALEQRQRAALRLPCVALMVPQWLLDGGKHLGRDEGRHRERTPVLLGTSTVETARRGWEACPR